MPWRGISHSRVQNDTMGRLHRSVAVVKPLVSSASGILFHRRGGSRLPLHKRLTGREGEGGGDAGRAGQKKTPVRLHVAEDQSDQHAEGHHQVVGGGQGGGGHPAGAVVPQEESKPGRDQAQIHNHPALQWADLRELA